MGFIDNRKKILNSTSVVRYGVGWLKKKMLLIFRHSCSTPGLALFPHPSTSPWSVFLCRIPSSLTFNWRERRVGGAERRMEEEGGVTSLPPPSALGRLDKSQFCSRLTSSWTPNNAAGGGVDAHRAATNCLINLLIIMYWLSPWNVRKYTNKYTNITPPWSQRSLFNSLFFRLKYQKYSSSKLQHLVNYWFIYWHATINSYLINSFYHF